MSSAGILVVGETVIDIVDREGRRTEHVGGSPATVALTLGRLGRAVRFATDLGDDDRGRLARSHLEASGVEVVATGRGVTSTAVAVIGADGSADYDFDLRWSPGPLDPSGAAHVHTGSIAAFLSPGAEAVGELIDRLPAGTTVSLDPNVRPDVLPPRPEVLRTVARLLARCDLVKLSDEDAAWLYPGEPEDAVLDRLLAAGPALAVLTRGGDGMLLASGQARVGVPASPVLVRDTIGAGDTAMGALIDAFLGLRADDLDGDALRRIGRWAATAAGVTASRAGANPPRRSELLP